MSGEIEKQIKEIVKNKNVTEQLMRVVGTAGQEFPCLSCPSKDECKTFNWFIKWFGKDLDWRRVMNLSAHAQEVFG